MTSNTLHNKIRTKLILVLLIIGMIFTSAFLFTACGTVSTDDDKTISYVEKDDGLISNPSFSFGTYDLAETKFPVTAPTGWSKSKDTYGASSSATSGIVSLTDSAWKELMNTLYKNSNYLNFVKEKFDFTTNDVTKAIKDAKGDQNYTPTNDEIREYIVDTYMSQLENPQVRAGAKDNKVYMLNNYTLDLGWGASQKITSSKSITINKGEYVKISVWVKTQYLTGQYSNLEGGKLTNCGASIRLTNSLNSATQSEFAIKNIQADDWTEYTLYAKGDANYESKITLALGLGYDIYNTQGTAYFDDVTVKHLTASEYESEKGATQNVTTLNFESDDKQVIDINSVTEDTILYDMTLDEKVGSYNKPVALSTTNVTGSFTTSSDNTTSKDKGWVSTANTSVNAGVVTTTLSNASYSVKIEDSAFSVQTEGYVYVSFYLQNKLSKFGTTTITAEVYEKFSTSDKVSEEKIKITETNDANEFTRYSIMVYNNFPTGSARNFYINLIIGPSAVDKTDNLTDYASGTVVIKDMMVATGKSFATDENDNPTPNYDLYKLYESTASGSTALYAGYPNDYFEENEDITYYSFKPANSDIGAIETRPAKVQNYKGVTTNHAYVSNGSDTISQTDTRIYGVNGSYAGLVDSKTTYSGFSVSSISNEDIRAMMIYNNSTDNKDNHYGFIGNTVNVAENAFAKISVTLKVDATATAYVYLIDSSSETKSVMKFVDFNENSDGVNNITQNQPSHKAEDLTMQFKVDSTSMANAVDGWLTLDFCIATGVNAKKLRVEVWNGGRDGLDSTASKGYVFVKSINTVTSNAFNEPITFNQAFVKQDSIFNPLADAGESSFTTTPLVYKRELTDIEKKYNSEQTNSINKISYAPKIVWAQNETLIYAVYNNLEVEPFDPYASNPEEDTPVSSGCTATSDPSTFWLSFSSILLAVALFVAIIMLFIKTSRRRRIARKKDIKTHYTVKSRIKANKLPNKKAKKVEKATEEIDETEEINQTEEVEETENVEESAETEQVETEQESTQEQVEEEYVYGEVQDFGDDNKSND